MTTPRDDAEERLTHNVLLNMESEAKPHSDVLILVAEVRRLRRLIAECYNGTDTNLTLLNLLTEAEAIRTEGGP